VSTWGWSWKELHISLTLGCRMSLSAQKREGEYHETNKCINKGLIQACMIYAFHLKNVDKGFLIYIRDMQNNWNIN